MAIDPALVEASDRSLIDSFRKLSMQTGEVLDAGEVFAFSTGLSVALFSSEFLADPDVEMFTAFLDGDPVGGSVAIRSGDVAGVYAVGTLEAARRRGVGSAATWACVRAAEGWGCDTVVLQSSEMGLGVYRAIGFETVVDYARYRLRQ